MPADGSPFCTAVTLNACRSTCGETLRLICARFAISSGKPSREANPARIRRCGQEDHTLRTCPTPAANA
jgi:hypothetical protein